jgi:MFS family permease
VSTLGSNFRRLVASATVSGLGDGVRIAALPLLAAALTASPTTIAAVTLAGGLPWALFALISGALVDRWDRRRVMALSDAARFLVTGVLVALVASDHSSIAAILVVAFLLGTAETFFDNASQAILPSIVDDALLERANGRLYASQIVTIQFVGPPLGALLFGWAMAVPFGFDSASFALSAILLIGITTTHSPRPVERPAGHAELSVARQLRVEIAEGLRWLWAHRPLRTLAITLGLFNFTGTAMESILVLFALHTLHIGKFGYGLLFTAFAVGGLLGTVVAEAIGRRIATRQLVLLIIVLCAVSEIVMGALPNRWLAGAMYLLQGFGAVVWNIVTVSLRQRIIPSELLGRVNSVYRAIAWGTMPLGALAGGFIARGFGLKAPFIFAGSVMLAVGVVSYPFLAGLQPPDPGPAV